MCIEEEHHVNGTILISESSSKIAAWFELILTLFISIYDRSILWISVVSNSLLWKWFYGKKFQVSHSLLRPGGCRQRADPLHPDDEQDHEEAIDDALPPLARRLWFHLLRFQPAHDCCQVKRMSFWMCRKTPTAKILELTSNVKLTFV